MKANKVAPEKGGFLRERDLPAFKATWVAVTKHASPDVTSVWIPWRPICRTPPAAVDLSLGHRQAWAFKPLQTVGLIPQAYILLLFI